MRRFLPTNSDGERPTPRPHLIPETNRVQATAITQSGLVFGAVSRGFGTSFHLLGRGDLYVVETVSMLFEIYMYRRTQENRAHTDNHS